MWRMTCSAFVGALAAYDFAHAQESADQRARFEQGQAAQRVSEQRQFIEAGFIPLAEATAEADEVRRVLFSDPYSILPVPGVEIRRQPNGNVTLTVLGRGVERPPVPLSEADWRSLTEAESEAFLPRVYAPWPEYGPDNPPPPPPRPCHAWSSILASGGADGERSASWSACSGDTSGGRYIFAATAAGLAVQNAPDCTFDAGSPFWSFSRCFTTVADRAEE
ncbi:MAG: hypothetical protein ACK4Y4_02010 [Brevundimonas sp.]